jgi:hypothetical protein
VVEHHPDGALTHLRRELRGFGMVRHGSSLSRVGASGKPGAVQELLDHAHSSAKTLRQAFGAQRWADLEPYLKSENGLWGFAL